MNPKTKTQTYTEDSRIFTEADVEAFQLSAIASTLTVLLPHVLRPHGLRFFEEFFVRLRLGGGGFGAEVG